MSKIVSGTKLVPSNYLFNELTNYLTRMSWNVSSVDLYLIRDLKNERENIVGRGSNMCEGSEAVGQDGWGQLCKALNAIIKR